MGVGVRDAFPPPSVCSCIHPFAYGNAAARTFGRAHRCRPYGFVWADCAWMVDFVWVDCVQMVILFVWDARKNMMVFGRGGACVPARVALPRAHPSLKSPRTMRVFLVWKRRCADVRAGTQAPPLRLRLDGLRVERLMSFWGLRIGG